MLPFLSLAKYTTLFLSITLILFLIVAFNVGKIIYGTRKIKNEFLKVINNGEPLMCFETNVIKTDKKKKELPDNRGWHLQPYILLDDDVELEISNDAFLQVFNQYEILLKNTTDENAISAIRSSVLAKYEELT